MTASPEIVPTVQETITIEAHASEQTTLLRFLWLSGASLLAAVFSISHLRNRWKYRFSLPLPAEVKIPVTLFLLDITFVLLMGKTCPLTPFHRRKRAGL